MQISKLFYLFCAIIAVDNVYLVLVGFLLAPSLCQQRHARQEQLDNSDEHYHGQDGQYHHSNDGRGWDIRLSVPGEPDIDYPVLNDVPRTSFNCVGKDSGYYADRETRCQVFRVCTTTGPSGYYSFLCPNGTLFNEELHVCDWWMNVDCSGGNSEDLSRGRIKVSPGSGMLQNIKNMIMYPMSHPIPSNYPKNHMTMQVYNPPVTMMSMFLSPPNDIEGQQLLGEVNSPNSLLNPNKYTTSVKQDSLTSGTTSFNNNPIVVNEFIGTVANTPTVQEDLNSKFIQQQAEILNLQKHFNSNTQQQSIKITKQQFTYPSEFDKQYTVTVPKIPTQINHPFVVNIPINIPAIDGNDNLVSEQMVSDETNNRSPFQNHHNKSFKPIPTTTVASIPFVILLLKPNEHNLNNQIIDSRPEDILTNSSNSFYNDHQNFIQRSEVRENAFTNSINYFYPHGFIKPSASLTQNPPLFYIPSTTNINYEMNDIQNIQPPNDGEDTTTVEEYNERTIDLDDTKDVQITESDKDLLMEQLNKHLDKQEQKLTNDLTTDAFNLTNTKSNNNSLVTIFSAHVLPNGDETNEQVLKLCIPKDVLIYLIRVHNATKRALEKHSPNYQFPSHEHQHSKEEMVNLLMNNVLMKDLDYSDQQVPIVNDAELFKNQQFVSFQNKGSLFRGSTNRRITDSTEATRKTEENSYHNTPQLTGNTQSPQNDLGSAIKHHTNHQTEQNQGDYLNKHSNQQATLTTNNRFSAKFNKDQLSNHIISGQQGGGAQIQTNVVRNNAGPSLGPKEENYDQYRITSSVDGPKTIEDEENRGEFFSLQHFGYRQQKIKPQQNLQQNVNNQPNIKQTVSNQNQQTTDSKENGSFNLNKNQVSMFQQNGQTSRVQQNNAKVLNGFAGLQRPMPFTRTQNSPPQQNTENRILNHNMAGFLNNGQVQDTKSQKASVQQTNNHNLNGKQGTVYTISQEQTKTFGPVVKEYSHHQSTQTIQNTPGFYQQAQVSFSGQNAEGNRNINGPVVTQVNVGRKEETVSPPAVNTQYYQTSNYQGTKNVAGNGGSIQTFSQTTQTVNPTTQYQHQTNRQSQINNVPQNNGQTASQGYVYNQNSQGYDKSITSQNLGTRIAQNVQTTNGNKYDQVLSIQKQLGGLNNPAPFMKTNRKQDQSLSNRQNNGQVSKSDVQFVTKNNYNQNSVAQNQFPVQAQNGFPNQVKTNIAGNNNQYSTTQQTVHSKNQINRIGNEFVTTNNQINTNNNRQLTGAVNQNTIGQSNRGVNLNSQVNGNSAIFSTNRFHTNSAQFANQFNNMGNQFVTKNNGRTQLNNGQVTQNQENFNVNTQNNVQSRVGFNNQNTVNRASFDQNINVNDLQRNQQSRQGGIQFNANLSPQRSPQTQFVTSNVMPNTKNVMTNIQVVPAFGFAIDSDRERNYYFSALARGLKDVDKIYIPPYDEATADMMISEINRQSQLGQFTPMTFDAMFNNFNSAPSFGVQAMLNSNFEPSSFGLQYSGKDGITSNQQILPTSIGGDQQVSMDELGYPKEKPRIAFTF